MYAVRIERDSIGPTNVRLTSFVLTYPRVVLAEVKTHRTLGQDTEAEFTSKTLGPDLSMNSASSRAIPVQKMLDRISADPFVPFFWGKNQRGMQAEEELDLDTQRKAAHTWRLALSDARRHAERLMELGVHKQVVNRLIEPFAWVTQIVTGTEDALANFFHLRCHKDAAPEFQRLARLMYLAYRDSEPKQLLPWEWHLPFIDEEEYAKAREHAKAWFAAHPRWFEEVPVQSMLEAWQVPLHVSVARCTRVSYLNHDGRRDLVEDLQLHDRLVVQSPVHASPAEHQGFPWQRTDYCSNLTGWLQYRKLLPNERVTTYKPSDDEVASWGLPVPAGKDENG